ncbi:unnamed protein product [Calicophoron daubneyi]|uniref:GP-PDE domain-containing protein n=1 Tax=Calicophoron daubneyi TaxID=300641 RepID=A0AAV2U0G5_CALDB
MLGAIALIALGYIVVSYVFFLFPRLLHKPKLVTQMPVHISHRGGAGERIENTLRAFQNAVELGTDMLELDCHLTKDGEVVILHDGNLKRSTGVNVDVSEVNYAELPQYLPKLEVQFHPGHFSHAKSPSDRKILRLFDLFTSFPHTPMNIDIKVDDDRLINKVGNMIREFHREKFTIWGSFSAKTCAKLKAANPAVPCFFPLDSVLRLFTYYVFGLLPFMPITYEYLELPLVAASNYPESATATGLNRIKMKVMLWLMDFLLCSPRLYCHLKARGVPNMHLTV